ncbi:hypothetical protein RBSH_03536 [Rhodopirellula baltica SH28]|uniref:Uncharacterized protein n=1 Tax=Rhodopirellula baltica SH28 TaxID=993517 RepID=K5D3E6_RHOBT|nr:hypothetical protein [Rhodopirellula baltica]EKK01137.1 hypothetical protein RBSH_03536 [Rhodopirellula baltica SH28]
MKIACTIVVVVATCGFGVSNAQSPEFQGPRFEGPRRPNNPSPQAAPSSAHNTPNHYQNGYPPHSSATGPGGGYGRGPIPPRTRSPHEEQALEWAMFLQHQLHQRVELDAECKLSDLPRLIQEEVNLPCTLDQAAMRIAGVTPAAAVVELQARELPLRVALKRALAPLNLAAKLTEDGLVVTADFTELARAGIATDRWAGISAETVEKMESDLNQTVSIETDNMPLDEAVASLQEHLHHRIVLDVFSMEGEGLSADIPVSIHAKETNFRSVMNRMLRDQNLTFQFEDDVWVVTTVTAAEDRPLNRIYYLEATGLTQSIGEAMQLVQTSVDPESWEVLGGMGTMAPLPTGGSNRPGILISTTFATHLKTEALFDALRAGTVGEDVPTKSEPFQDPMSSGSFHPHGYYVPGSDPALMSQGNSSSSSQNAPNNSAPNTPQQTGGMF